MHVGGPSVRKSLGQFLVDAYHGNFDNVSRGALYSCVHCLAFCLISDTSHISAAYIQ